MTAVIVFGGVLGVFGYHGYHHFFAPPKEHHEADVPTEQVAATGDCPAVGHTIRVALTDTGWDPSPVNVKHCDLVVITNASSKGIRPAIGDHDLHQAYPSFTEKDLRPGETVQFQAQAVGEFRLHDHIHDATIFHTDLIVTE